MKRSYLTALALALSGAISSNHLAAAQCSVWTSGASYPSVFSPGRIATGDIDLDGQQDMVVFGNFGYGPHVLRNQGAGSFSTQGILSGANEPYVGQLGDLDGDGFLDLVVAIRGDVGSSGFPENYGLQVYQNLGNGSFGAPTAVYFDSTGFGPTDLALGDMDNDGDLDAVCTGANYPLGASGILVAFNTNGVLGIPAITPRASILDSLRLGDVNQDGNLDVVCADNGGCSVVPGDGSGGFLTNAAAHYSNPANYPTSQIDIGDLDSDGDIDIAVARQRGRTIHWNDGTGLFPTNYPGVSVYHYFPRSVVVTDYDNDGDLDAVFNDYYGMIVLDNTGSTPAVVNMISTTDPQCMTFFDVDGDADLDLVVGNRQNDTLDVFHYDNACIASFCDPMEVNSTGQPTRLFATHSGSPGSGYHLEATQGPSSFFGYFLVSTTTSIPGTWVGNGRLCLPMGTSAPLGRYNVSGTGQNSLGQFDSAGVLQNVAGTSTTGTGFDIPLNVPVAGNPTIVSGTTLHFQLWHRDQTPLGSGTNFSNGVSIVF